MRRRLVPLAALAALIVGGWCSPAEAARSGPVCGGQILHVERGAGNPVPVELRHRGSHGNDHGRRPSHPRSVAQGGRMTSTSCSSAPAARTRRSGRTPAARSTWSMPTSRSTMRRPRSCPTRSRSRRAPIDPPTTRRRPTPSRPLRRCPRGTSTCPSSTGAIRTERGGSSSSTTGSAISATFRIGA